MRLSTRKKKRTDPNVSVTLVETGLTIVADPSGKFVFEDVSLEMARNPFTGEMVQVEARPASLSVRATAMKALKDVVS